MPINFQKDLRQIAFTYGPDRARFKRIDTNETGTSTTIYAAGGTYEVTTNGGQVTKKTMIAGVAVVETG